MDKGKMADEEEPGVSKCVLCSEDTSSGTSSGRKFLLHRDRRALKAVFYEVLHHLLIPNEEIPQVYRLCRQGPFCLRCMGMLDKIWTMQKTIAKTQILLQNKAETLGKIIAAAPLFSADKGLLSKRSKRDRELWTQLRNPVIQNFAKDLLPYPRVVLTDIVENRKKKRRHISEDDGKICGNSKTAKSSKNVKETERDKSEAPRSEGRKEVNVDAKIRRIRTPEMPLLSPAVELKELNNNKEALKLREVRRQSGETNPANSTEVTVSVGDVARSVSSICTASTTQTNNIPPFLNESQNALVAQGHFSHPGLQFPFGQPYPSTFSNGHAVFVSYIPIEALSERSSNCGRVGLISTPPPAPSPCDKSTSGTPDSITLNARHELSSGKMEPSTTTSITNGLQVKDRRKIGHKDISLPNETSMNVNISSELVESDLTDVRPKKNQRNISEGEDNYLCDIDDRPSASNNSCLKIQLSNNTLRDSSIPIEPELDDKDNNSLLLVCCPKCDFNVNEKSKESSLERIYVHYGKEHLTVDKEDPCVSEDQLEYYKCPFCPFKSFINEKCLNSRRSRSHEKRQYAIVSLAKHCIGVHEPMIEPILVTPHLPGHSFMCSVNNCGFEIPLNGKSKSKAYLKLGYHYLKSHMFPGFPLLDSNHPSYKVSARGRYFQCPSCSETFKEHGPQSKRNVSAKFVTHLAKSHAMNISPTILQNLPQSQVTDCSSSLRIPQNPPKSTVMNRSSSPSLVSQNRPKSNVTNRSSSSLIPKQLLRPGAAGIKCPECDFVIRTQRKLRYPSDVKRHMLNVLKKHYLEIHKRRTIPQVELDIIDTNGKSYENFKVSFVRKLDLTPANVEECRAEDSGYRSYLNRTKCPKCAFTCENNCDSESRFSALALHFTSHIPIKSSDSESINSEQNDDGMICMRNVYVCKKCPFMSRARPEGSSMTDLHQDLAEHYLRVHYSNEITDTNSPITPQVFGTINTKIDILSQANTNPGNTYQHESSSENIRISLEEFQNEENDLSSSIKIEGRSSFMMDWETAELEDMEIFNIGELEQVNGGDLDFSSADQNAAACMTSATIEKSQNVGGIEIKNGEDPDFSCVNQNGTTDITLSGNETSQNIGEFQINTRDHDYSCTDINTTLDVASATNETPQKVGEFEIDGGDPDSSSKTQNAATEINPALNDTNDASQHFGEFEIDGLDPDSSCKNQNAAKDINPALNDTIDASQRIGDFEIDGADPDSSSKNQNAADAATDPVSANNQKSHVDTEKLEEQIQETVSQCPIPIAAITQTFPSRSRREDYGWDIADSTSTEEE